MDGYEQTHKQTNSLFCSTLHYTHDSPSCHYREGRGEDRLPLDRVRSMVESCTVDMSGTDRVHACLFARMQISRTQGAQRKVNYEKHIVWYGGT